MITDTTGPNPVNSGWKQDTNRETITQTPHPHQRTFLGKIINLTWMWVVTGNQKSQRKHMSAWEKMVNPQRKTISFALNPQTSH